MTQPESQPRDIEQPRFEYSLRDEEKQRITAAAHEMGERFGDDSNGVPVVEVSDRGVRIGIEMARADLLKGLGFRDSDAEQLSPPMNSNGLLTHHLAHRTQGGSTFRETAVFSFDEHTGQARRLVYSYLHLP